ADDLSGNLTGLHITEETALNTLATTPVWYEREPNTYTDFGGTYAMTARVPITHDRQAKKGAITDVTPAGGWNEDLTANNMPWLMQGFLFADAREKPSSAPLNGTFRQITAVANTDDSYAASAGLGSFIAGHLIYASGFNQPTNNGLKTVVTSASGKVTVSETLADEASPPSIAKFQAVGFEFPSGTVALDVAASDVMLTSSTTDLTTLGFNVGEWVFVGGDDTSTRFADTTNNAPFYARIASVEAGALTFDKTTGTQIDDDGTGKTIQIFFPNAVVRNEEDCTLIKRRSYQIERQYGCGAGTVEAEYLTGSVPNEMTIHVPTPGADAKVNVDLTFMPMLVDYASVDDGVKAGTRVTALEEGFFSTSFHVYQNKLNVIDPTTLNPAPLVGYVSESTITINNNVAGNKAIGVFGNYNANVGMFTVTGSDTTYFTSLAATQAVRANPDVTRHIILTRQNAGIVFDFPLISLGGGLVSVAANTPVTVPLDSSMAKGAKGYTMMVSFFPYLPTVGMANS
ncbi:MAG TPA: phage tail tube protein, partial [Dongiaceae bacterium]|nr:phage tail tube protein [Dongiaceae bacterium]